MTRYILPALLILAACSDGGEGRRTLDPSHLRIIAGDQQAAPVGVTASSAVFRAYGTAAQNGAANVLPDTLVTEIQGTVSGRDGLVGPSSNIDMPAGTIVEYAVLSDGCGAPYISSVTPDADARTRTLWEVPGARANLTPVLQGLQWHVVDGDSIWAARCEMQARLKLGSEFRADTSFVAYFQPGPVVSVAFEIDEWAHFLGDTVTLAPPSVMDVHRNAHPRDVEWSGDGAERLVPSRSITHRAWRDLDSPAAERTDVIIATRDGLADTTRVHWLQRIGEGWQYELRCGPGVALGYNEPIDSMRITLTVDEASRGNVAPLPGYIDHQYIASVGEVMVAFAERDTYQRSTRVPGQLHHGPGALHMIVWDGSAQGSVSVLAADGPGHYVGTETSPCTNPISETFSAPSP